MKQLPTLFSFPQSSVSAALPAMYFNSKRIPIRDGKDILTRSALRYTFYSQRVRVELKQSQLVAASWKLNKRETQMAVTNSVACY